MEEWNDFSKLHINQNDIKEAIKAFRFFDRKKTGLIPIEDLHRVYESLGMKLKSTEIAQMLMDAGVHEFENEMITLYDFLSATLRKVHRMNV
ncbi:MAG: hypothetical protein V2I33_18825 [Kangiellaceae bacterium]|jgi:Ca2+-binding EF-hand superfamily protein|nr:hypothetical protein [Kangiellaceae bacterium]